MSQGLTLVDTLYNPSHCSLPQDLQIVLSQHESIFLPRQGLPTKRAYNHSINLLPGSLIFYKSLLKRDRELLGSSSKHPQAIVLCATEEKAAQCFNAAKYIIDNTKLKSAKDCASPDNGQSQPSIGLMIGTPCEIFQYIEDESIVPSGIRYLVLDEADCMLGSGLSHEIHKILRPLQDHGSKSAVKRLQTILAISTMAEVLGEESPIVKHLECHHAGNISAMSLEMEQTEVFHFTESLHALRKKLEEAMSSLLQVTS
ncbi:unnamed protein product [Sphenostylis stenocarpa]|uniref:Helicase ATP-binding domain-containing protein n=1 Tax=Sphenostylis stenocarpa TaxID=92480 RepID=A0AA86VPN0_9FABA|nr:unnamed protein product [Sphenostylis stenocarpa]